jgi:hypothetical protein
MSNISADLSGHMAPSEDVAPRVIATDSSGVVFGRGYPGYLGDNASRTAIDTAAGDTVHNPGGILGKINDSSGVPVGAMLRDNATGRFPNAEYGGEPGRVGRLAYDETGPATSTVVESFAMTGQRVKPGRPDLARGGPVGASGDLGQYLAVAVAQSTYDFPPQDLAQLNMLLGL